jgi:hypothetical protein
MKKETNNSVTYQTASCDNNMSVVVFIDELYILSDTILVK